MSNPKASTDSPGLEGYRTPMNSPASDNSPAVAQSATLIHSTAYDPGQTPWSDTAISTALHELENLMGDKFSDPLANSNPLYNLLMPNPSGQLHGSR